MQPSIVAAFYYKVPLQYFNTADFCELELYYWEVSFTLVKEVIVLELTPPLTCKIGQRKGSEPVCTQHFDLFLWLVKILESMLMEKKQFLPN